MTVCSPVIGVRTPIPGCCPSPPVTIPPDAQYYLAILHYYGEGMPEDVPEALALFRKAAEQGHVEAMVNMGLILAGAGGHLPSSDPVPRVDGPSSSVNDSTTAPATTATATVSGGSGNGSISVGGGGVGVDYQSSAAWLTKAAGQGDDTAQWLLGRLYYDGHVTPTSGDRYREALRVRGVAPWRCAAAVSTSHPTLAMLHCCSVACPPT